MQNGQPSSGQNMFNSSCKPFKCSKNERISSDGHSCMPVGSESDQDLPRPPVVFPAEGESPCQSSGGNYFVGAIFDIDTRGPDVTVVVIPKQTGEKISRSDIQVRANVPGINPSVSLLNQVDPLNAATTLLDSQGRPTNEGKQAQKLYQTGIREKRNQAYDIIFQTDSAAPTTVGLGIIQEKIKKSLEAYKAEGSNTVARIIKHGIQALAYPIPDNSDPTHPKNTRGRAYLFSMNLDKPGANVAAATLPGQSSQVIIQIKNRETIPLNLQRKTDGANWRASCVD